MEEKERKQLRVIDQSFHISSLLGVQIISLSLSRANVQMPASRIAVMRITEKDSSFVAKFAFTSLQSRGSRILATAEAALI